MQGLASELAGHVGGVDVDVGQGEKQTLALEFEAADARESLSLGAPGEAREVVLALEVLYNAFLVQIAIALVNGEGVAVLESEWEPNQEPGSSVNAKAVLGGAVAPGQSTPWTGTSVEARLASPSCILVHLACQGSLSAVSKPMFVSKS